MAIRLLAFMDRDVDRDLDLDQESQATIRYIDPRVPCPNGDCEHISRRLL